MDFINFNINYPEDYDENELNECLENIEIDEAIDLSIKYLNVYFTKEELIDVFPLIKNRYKECCAKLGYDAML